MSVHGYRTRLSDWGDRPRMIVNHPDSDDTNATGAADPPECCDDRRIHHFPIADGSWQAPLVDLLCILLRQKRMIIVVITCGIVYGLYCYLTTPKTYRSRAQVVLLPREKPIIDASINTGFLKLAESGASRELSGALMLPPRFDLYTKIIRQRAVLENLADRFGHRLTGKTPQAYDAEHQAGRDRLIIRIQQMISIEDLEENMLAINVTAHEPQLAADMANALIEEAENGSRQIERTLMYKQIDNLEQAIGNARIQLAGYEEQLKQFTSDNALIDPELQVASSLELIRELMGHIQVEKAALAKRQLKYTERDPEVREIMARIDMYQRQLDELRNRIVGPVGEDQFGTMLVEFENLAQRVKAQRELITSLSTQVDIFRIRAEQPPGNMAVIQEARAALRPSGPSRKRTIGLPVGCSIFLAIALAILIEQWRAAQIDQYIRSRLLEIRALLVNGGSVRDHQGNGRTTEKASESELSG